LAELIERLGGAIVVAHSQGGENMNHVIRLLKERSELSLLKGILYPESGAGVSLDAFATAGITPADFDNTSFFMWRADYATIAQRRSNRAVVDAINASPTRTAEPAAFVELDGPEFGGRFNGTGHLSMMSTNNLDAFDFMLDWAEKNIDNPIVQASCTSDPEPDNPANSPKK
jgi:pimeloyl-ACP methyl ester carboxylesterase